MMRNIRFFVGVRCLRFFVLGLLLTACAHTPETRSPRLIQATDFNQEGEKAYRYGEYQSAIENFQASLLINESVENLDGIAINLIDLAKSYQAIESLNEAHRAVDRILQDKVLHFPDEYLAAAAAQKSLLLLSQNDLVDAARWVDKAMSWCAQCRVRGTVLNVQSNIALRRNDAVAAARWAEMALKENKGRSPVEYANSLRLLARAKLSGNNAGAALPLLEEALELDKRLGMPAKIAYDMNIIAEVYLALGDQNKAYGYRERARRVSGEIRHAE